jgi:hypothetical protein
MQITVPNSGYFLITSKGEHIPLGAHVDVAVDGVTYINAEFNSMTVGALGCDEETKAEPTGIGLYIEDDDDFVDIDDINEIDEIILHSADSSIGALYELATHGLSKDEFIERFKKLAAEYGDGK